MDPLMKDSVRTDFYFKRGLIVVLRRVRKLATAGTCRKLTGWAGATGVESGEEADDELIEDELGIEA